MRQPIYILLLLLLLATSGFGVYAAESPSPKVIRVIFGHEIISKWTQRFTETIGQIFLADPRVIFQTDYMPLNAQDPASFTLFSTLEQAGFTKADAIIAVRPEASAFVTQWKDRLFPGIPIVYVVPSDEAVTADLVPGTDGLVPGVIDAAARGTFDLLPQLLPDLEHIYILSGDSAADTFYLLNIRSAIQEAGLQQTIHYLIGLTPSEVSAELNAAPQNTAAVLSLYTKDRTGQLFSGASDVARIISAQTDTPLFGFSDSMLNSGIIGGSLTSAALYATKAAEQTFALLFGDTPPANLETPTAYIFDAIQLDRFGIDRDLLPEGSEVINAYPTLLQLYRWQFTLAGTTLLILLFLIVSLGRSLRRGRSADAEREASIAIMQEAQRIAHVGSWRFDLASNRVTWTPELYHMLGLDPELPPPLFTEQSKLFTAESWERLSSSMSRTLASGNPYELELKTVKPDGKQGWMVAKGEAVRDVSGSITGFRGTALDTSEFHEINDQLRHAQKMDAVGQLTGGIAHDFNNILAIIIGNLELVQLAASDDIKILRSVDQALQGAARGTVLINKILGFSRGPTNEISTTSVNQLLENMNDLLTKSLTVSIKIETHLDAKLWPVNIDAGDLEDAILNMALNARDAMPNGGRLVIVTANKLLDADFVKTQPEARIGAYAMLSISDNGIGMSSEVREKALEPFFTTKPSGEGTGLGLSMVYGFVRRSGGFIAIVSEPDAGTSINIFLPRELRAEQVEIPTIDKEELPRGNETVLVVDDEEELAKLAVANLERLGYTVLTGFDAKSALSLIEEKPNIDLLFSDVIMPGKMDGYDLGITAKKANPALRILLTSGFTKWKEDDPSPDIPMIDGLTRNLLRKPYNKRELAKAVRKALN